MYPFRPHYFQRGHLRYHYLDEGSGDPVVMVHGNPTWSFYYRNLVKALMPSHRVIVPDHLGCGLSDKPDEEAYGFRLQHRIDDLTALLDHLALENVTLVLHDWGGAIGMGWAVRYPQRIKKVVILNTAAFLPPAGKPIPRRLRLIRDSKIGRFLVLRLNLFARAALYMASSKGLPPMVKRAMIAPYDHPKTRLATYLFVADIPLQPEDESFRTVADISDALPKLSHLPMLICWGCKDFVFDLDYLAEWRQRFPHARVHQFVDAGHYILEDARDSVNALIKDFIHR